ncbi:MAG: hypothetical protein ACTSPK_11005, partial [Candidatus Heimdallarchaeota archaeon]
PGDYVIELSVQDLLANIYTNTTFLSFTLEDTDKASIGLLSFMVFSLIIATALNIRRRKK